jgi:LPS-assembly protein
LGGALAIRRGPTRLSRLIGATALACIFAATALPYAAEAQDIGLDNAAVSNDAQMLLEADTIVYDNDRNTVAAIGGVQIEYDGYTLVAQKVTYDQNTSRLVASGNVEIVDRDGTRIYSDEIDITDDFRDGFVQTLRVETADKTYFAAESAERRDGEVTTFNQGVYTACAPCEDNPDKPPIWRVKAKKIIWNGKTKTVRFERSRFEFFGFPLAFLPVFEIADPTVKQKSGFLFPSYRVSDELGHGVRVPYYWGISPTYDITFKPTWYSKQGFLAEAEWRQQFNNGQYSITVAGIRQQNPEEFYRNRRQELRSADAENWRGMIGTKGEFEINPRWTFGWDVMVQSDKYFAKRYGIDGFTENTRYNQIYLTGLNDRNYFDLRGYKINIQETRRDYNPVNGRDEYNARNSRQPWVLPSFDYSYTPDEPVFGGELNIDVNLTGIHRGELDLAGFAGQRAGAIRGIEGTSARLTTEAEWKRSFIAPGGLMLTPLLHGRVDAIGVNYSDASLTAIDNFATRNSLAADVRSEYYRAMATAGLEARWPILFSTTSSTHILEPMAQLFARPDATYGDTLGIPNEDAQSLVFDASNLFERDKFSGYDRIEGGVRANLGVRYSASFGDGWAANALFGQSFHLAGANPYASPDFVQVGAFSGLETNRSDYVGSVDLISPVGLSLGASARFDEESFEVRRTDARAGYSNDILAVSSRYSLIEAQPGYGFSHDRQEIRASASVRVQENWRVFGSTTFAFGGYDDSQGNPIEDTFVKKSIGFAYDDECFSYTLTATEKINQVSGEKAHTFGFSVSLRTIGDFGTSSNNSAFGSF